MELIDAIKNRWSPKAFSNQPIEEEKIEALFKAARWAASCFNEQPWRFIYATQSHKAEWEKLHDCLADGNKPWVKTAPFLLVTVAKSTFTRNDKPNKHSWHDVGLAMGNLSAQATAMGLHLHQMAGFSAEKAKANLNIPDGYEPVTMVAVGYKGSPDDLPEGISEPNPAERKRKPMEEIVFKNQWNG